MVQYFGTPITSMLNVPMPQITLLITQPLQIVLDPCNHAITLNKWSKKESFKEACKSISKRKSPEDSIFSGQFDRGQRRRCNEVSIHKIQFAFLFSLDLVSSANGLHTLGTVNVVGKKLSTAITPN